MEFDTVPTDVLDLLFDGHCGLMKDDKPAIPHINNNIGKRDFAEGGSYTEQDSIFHNITFVSIFCKTDSNRCCVAVY